MGVCALILKAMQKCVDAIGCTAHRSVADRADSLRRMAGAAWRAHERDVHVAQLGVWEGGRTYYLEFSDQNILTFKNVLVRQKASTKEKNWDQNKIF